MARPSRTSRWCVSDNVLSYFKNFQDQSTELYHNAFVPQFPLDFIADAAKGNLPQVSWILASLVDSDHPPAPTTFGENTLSLIIQALTANPITWAKTVLFSTYDENGGFFDHVPPRTAPAGTPGEYVTAASVPDPAAAGGITGPIGLGFRIPMMIISPLSRGGFVSSDRSTTRPSCGSSRRASEPRCRTSPRGGGSPSAI